MARIRQIYPTIYLDAIVVKVRDGHQVRNRHAHIAVGVDLDGVKHVLGIFTGHGHARFYARIGIEQFRKEADGSFTKLDPTFHDLVMFDRTAERAYARFKVGDQFVASGYIHEYELEKKGDSSEVREQFVARRIGHDCARTRYAVDRTPSRQPDPPSDQLSGVSERAQAVGR